MNASYPTSEGRKLLLALIDTVDTNGAYLSEIDGATGDGDHEINMTKGVRRTKEGDDCKIGPCESFGRTLKRSS